MEDLDERIKITYLHIWVNKSNEIAKEVSMLIKKKYKNKVTSWEARN